MIVHACDACGIAIKAGRPFGETLCGECAEEGLPTVAHTVCEACAARGVDVVRLALQHQVLRHGLPPHAVELEPIPVEIGELRRRFVLPALGVATGQPQPA